MRTESMTPVHVLDFLSKVSIKKKYLKKTLCTHICVGSFTGFGKNSSKASKGYRGGKSEKQYLGTEYQC
jgi:hypothetical protein